MQVLFSGVEVLIVLTSEMTASPRKPSSYPNHDFFRALVISM